MRAALPFVTMLLVEGINAQDVRFAPTPYLAMAEYSRQQTRMIGPCKNEPSPDTLDAEASRAQPSLWRYEYYLDGTVHRRIEIVEELRDMVVEISAMPQEDHESKVVRLWQDVPRGRYQEYHPNGRLRLEGKLDGHVTYGIAKKTGEWVERDEKGNVIRRETHP
ncbi:MAG: hypothetical protein RBT71_06485 [Flavobacteriales bacterium]|jgi:hypothetical protein|nr:hypothetical protein [Flavobacteriales bacterium]